MFWAFAAVAVQANTTANRMERIISWFLVVNKGRLKLYLSSDEAKEQILILR
jgi:hypothetical protein